MATASSGGSASLGAFPANKKDFLAMMYLQNQDLTGKTPEEIASMYDEAYEKIEVELARLRDERKKLKRNGPYQSVF